MEFICNDIFNVIARKLKTVDAINLSMINKNFRNKSIDNIVKCKVERITRIAKVNSINVAIRLQPQIQITLFIKDEVQNYKCSLDFERENAIYNYDDTRIITMIDPPIDLIYWYCDLEKFIEELKKIEYKFTIELKSSQFTDKYNIN